MNDAAAMATDPVNTAVSDSPAGDSSDSSAGVDSSAVAESEPSGSSGSSSDNSLIRLQPYYWIFAASGFAGLIYESVWARYIKLLLGNAAAAQVLVLAIFLVSLAIGAALCAKVSERLHRPLLWYAAIEAVVAVVAVYFHEIFVFAQQWALTIIPALDSDFSVEAFKFAFAVLLIAPQTILLGATFPLMSAGLVRFRPESSGRIIALLYFTNTLGGTAGVLISGFLLIPLIGLPGTVAVGGLISAVVGAVVWAISRQQEGQTALTAAAAAAAENSAAENSASAENSAPSAVRLQWFILAAAFITGLASLIYEVVWIRMLSTLLGPVTQIFELMIAAFILGLALGGWAVHRRVDNNKEPLIFLAWVQLAMGALALWSLVAFPLAYDILRDSFYALRENPNGYELYHLLALAVSMVMMLPASFCAGMTLPLLTRRLLSAGGEGAIGRVYAVNTLGAVCGVFVALHFLLPGVGIHLSLLFGASLDMLLGVGLLVFAATRIPQWVGGGLTFATLTCALVFGGISPQIAASSVFYRLKEGIPTVVFHQNGKTALVAVTEGEFNGTITRHIRTNGAVNSAIAISPPNAYSFDEITTTMAGLVPLLFRPDAETVMNIGFGTGLTSRTLLLSPNLQRLDNVEIEPVMIEGAKHLGEKITPVFSDPRNKFIFNDAKTALVRSEKYDIIVSEPSYPWISGVAALFTTEFYAQVRRSLAHGGIFAQWVPVYDQDSNQVASIIGALDAEFEDFRLYIIDQGDFLVVAANEKLPPLSNDIFRTAAVREFFADYNTASVADANILYLGDKSLLAPYFLGLRVPINSDYHPYLENNAFRAAFFQEDFQSFAKLPLLPIPLLELLGGEAYNAEGVRPNQFSPIRRKAASAWQFYTNRHNADGELQKILANLAAYPCPTTLSADHNDTRFLQRVSSLFSLLIPAINKNQMSEVWEVLETSPCVQQLLQSSDSVSNVYMHFWRALSLRDAAAIIETTDLLLPQAELDQPSGQVILLAAMAAHYQQKDYPRVLLLLQELPIVDPSTTNAALWIASLAAEQL